MSILPHNFRIFFEFRVCGGKDEQRSKRRLIFREGILFCLGKIIRIWKRKIIFGEGKYFFQKRTNLGKKIRSKSRVGKFVF